VSDDSGKLKVLFVCYANMIRSQMAEGFARHMGSAFIDVHSAGLHPTGMVSGEAKEVMLEKGIDISSQSSKPLRDVPVEDMDYIVNLSGQPSGHICSPAYQGVLIDWEIGDPVGRPMDYYRSARDTIEERVRELVQRLWKESPTAEGS
jgi:arsenate reductase